MGQAGEILVNILAPPLVALLISFIALGFGALLASPFFPGKRSPFTESFAVGGLAIALLTLLWSLMGWMGPSGMWSLGFLVILLGLLGWFQSRPAFLLNPASFQNRTILTLALLLGVGVLLRICLSPLYPPTSLNECRSTLPTAISILTNGRMIFQPEISFSSLPQNAEMLYIWTIVKAPLSTSHYLNFIAYLFSLLAIVRLGRAVYSVKTGWLAAVILGSLGNLQILAGHAEPNLWIVLYILVALASLIEGMKERAPGRILLAGILLGGAAGFSYTSLIAAIGLALSLLALGSTFHKKYPIPRWAWISAILLFAAVALPWYLRNIFWFLNPVFPYFSSAIRPGGGIYGLYGPECAVRTEWLHATDTAFYYYQEGTLWAKILSLWPTWIGIPAGIWFWRASPFARASIVWTFLVWGFWMVGGGGIIYMPFLLYLIPVNILVFTHLLGVGYSQPPGDAKGRFFRIVLWALLIGWVGIFGARTAQLAPPLTDQQKENFLSRTHGSYNLIEAANEVIADDRNAVGILCEDGRLYADFELLGGGDVGWANHRLISDSCISPESLANLLHDRYGANYFIVHENRLSEHTSVVFASIRAVMRAPHFRDIFREVARVGEGAVYYVGSPDHADIPNPEVIMDEVQ